MKKASKLNPLEGKLSSLPKWAQEEIVNRRRDCEEYEHALGALVAALSADGMLAYEIRSQRGNLASAIKAAYPRARAVLGRWWDDRV